MAYGTSADVVQNLEYLEAALRSIESKFETDTPEQIRAALCVPLIAKQIAYHLDDDWTPANVLLAFDLLRPVLEDCKSVEGIDDGFKFYDIVDDVLTDITGEADDVQVTFGEMLTSFREALDKMTAWVAGGKFKFGKVPKRPYWAAVSLTNPVAGHSCMNYMNHVHVLRTIAGQLRAGVVQEES